VASTCTLPDHTRHTAVHSAHGSVIKTFGDSPTILSPVLPVTSTRIHILSRMGALISSLRSRCITLCSRWFRWSPPLRPGASCPSHHERLRDIEEGEIKAPCPSPPPKKRALLVGIAYLGSTSPIWTPLDGPHVDVEHFRKLLIRAYFIHRSVVFPMTLNSYPRYLWILARRHYRSQR